MLLDGKELAGYIKERQAKAVRGLRHNGIEPHLVIILTTDDPVNAAYVRVKQSYGKAIDVKVNILQLKKEEVVSSIKELNSNEQVHGIIVQLPLLKGLNTAEVLNTVATNKDVDGLTTNSRFDAPTPNAILWLLTGYNVELKNKKVVLIGAGRLVGAPLAKMLQQSGISSEVYDVNTNDIPEKLKEAEIIVTATGQPGLITSSMVAPKAVVIDAGSAYKDGKVVGDAAPELYQRQDIKISPNPGGVGPLTVCALFENVIQAARLAG